MKKRNKYQSGSMAKINSDNMPILIDPGSQAGGKPDFGSGSGPLMPKPAKPVKTNKPEPRPRPKPKPRPNLAPAVMEESKTKPKIKAPILTSPEKGRGTVGRAVRPGRGRPVRPGKGRPVRPGARPRPVRPIKRFGRAEGGMTDFKSIYDMEKKSGK